MSAAAAAKTTALDRALVTVAVMTATIMQTLDTTIANVALPHMQGSMSATIDQIAWVITSYIVAAAIMTPPTGFLAARFGRRRVFLFSVAGFTAASMLCGLATSLPEIVAYRVLQGLCGAALVPLSQSTLLDTYPPEKHGSAMAMWGVGVMIGPIVGPTLGGYLTDLYEWRWVFYINLPFGMLAFLGILAFVPETDRTARPFDVFGFALLSIALASFQLMLDRGHSQDWFSSIEIVMEATLAGLFLYLFLVQMFTAKHPFLEPALFVDRNFAVGLIVMFMVSIVLLSTMTLLPPFLQHIMKYPVLDTGLLLVPRGIGTMISMFATGRLAGKMDGRLLILLGLGIIAVSLDEMSRFTAETSETAIAWIGFLQGFGLGCTFVPQNLLTFATLPIHHRNEGTAMYSLLRNMGSSIGVAIVVTLLAASTQINRASLVEHVTPINPMLQPPFLPPQWSLETVQGLATLDAEIMRQAETIAYLNDFTFLMWLTLAIAPFLFLYRAPRRNARARALAASIE